MMTVPLHGKKAAGRVVQVDDAKYELAIAHRWNVYERVRTSGRVNGPYAITHIRQADGRLTTISMHRLITGWKRTDHVDGDGLNCQQSNMRDATASQNGANSQPRVGGASAYKGVQWRKNRQRWVALIRVERTIHWLGSFADEVEAARAYDAAAVEAWGPFAQLNFPGH